jgi:hypothetical protein
MNNNSRSEAGESAELVSGVVSGAGEEHKTPDKLDLWLIMARVARLIKGAMLVPVLWLAAKLFETPEDCKQRAIDEHSQFMDEHHWASDLSGEGVDPTYEQQQIFFPSRQEAGLQQKTFLPSRQEADLQQQIAVKGIAV